MRLKMLPAQAMLTLPDGTEKQVSKLGRGRYTTAWQNCTSVYLQVRETEYSKEILCELSGMNRNKHIPDCKRLEWADDNQPYRWYQMPLYRPLTAKCKEAWTDFRILQQMRDSIMTEIPYPERRTVTAHEINQRFLDKVQESLSLSPAIKEAIEQLVDSAANYDEYLTEITKKNCAVDDAGNLILLDPLFDWKEVQQARERAMKHHGY